MARWNPRVLASILSMVTATGAGAEMIDGIEVEIGSSAAVFAENAESPLALAAPPDAISIDFDAVSAPCGFNRTAALRDEFADLGVLFDGPAENDGGAILDECGSFGLSGYSSPNLFAFNANSQMPDGGTARGPATLLFDPLVNLVQVLAGSRTDEGQVLSMTAYGPDGAWVDMASVTLTPEMQALSVSGPSIREVVVSGPGIFALDDLAFVVATIEVDLDIRPRNDRNRVKPASRGVIPVAILGSDHFDVADVDVSTLAFGPSGAPRAHPRGPHFRDVNRDGWKDLLTHFRSDETGIEPGQMQACISGARLDGTPFRGCDAIRTVPDMDGDGLHDRHEKRFGTDPLNPDTDGDGFGDGAEVHVTGTDPLNSRDLPPPPLD
ncbi:MAG: hypothetical protein JRE43_11430 [Deltaproteobacteria bacterium]|nr:hypothetical protein [Deltaproteobacteria bacterium]MBW2542816.1 hypothetical protein [Deltaproteobacteria bacterium]